MTQSKDTFCEDGIMFGIEGEPYGRKADGSFYRWDSREEAEYRADEVAASEELVRSPRVLEYRP